MDAFTRKPRAITRKFTYDGTATQRRNRYGLDMRMVRMQAAAGDANALTQLKNRLDDRFYGQGRYGKRGVMRRARGRGDYSIFSGMSLVQPWTWAPIKYHPSHR